VKVATLITVCGDQAEAELELARLTKLRHPNVASLLGYALTDSSVELYEDWVGGESLASFCRQFAPVQVGLLRRIGRGVLEGLDYLHSADPQVVHGKVQASNVIVDRYLTPKLVDLPHSAVASLGQTAPTPARSAIVTPQASTDIWAFGKMLLELVLDFGIAADTGAESRAASPGAGSRTPGPPGAAPQELLCMVWRCLELLPRRRPSAWQLLVAEPFFEDAWDDEKP